MVSCVAYGCQNRHDLKMPGISFHRFPKDAKRRALWRLAVRRKNFTPSQSSSLCSIHFTEDCIDRTSLAIVRLRKNALPTIFPGYPTHLQTKEIKQRLLHKVIVTPVPVEQSQSPLPKSSSPTTQDQPRLEIQNQKHSQRQLVKRPHVQKQLLHGSNGKFLNDSEHGVPYGCTDDLDISPRKILQDPTSADNKCADKHTRSGEPLSMVKKIISYVSVCGERKSMAFDDSAKSKSPSCEAPEISKRIMREENEALRKLITEKEQEIKSLKMALSNLGSGYDKKVKYPYVLHSRTQREELQVVHEALSSLRKCFPANDPYQHTLDTIEQSLSALLERVNSLEIGVLSPQQSQTTAEVVLPGVTRRSNFEHSIEARKNTLNQVPSFSQRMDADHDITKVVYYMDKSVTPFRCVLNKRIGEATLRDFKLLFDRPGQYRYHFKTLDPEFGMVKEEVLNDDDLLPGWDGKIIAWIEEDCS